MILSMNEFCVGKEHAEKYVLSLCKDLKLPFTSRKDLFKKFKHEKTGVEVDLHAEVQHVRKYGTALHLQDWLDQNDRYLNSPVSFAIFGDDCGISCNMSSEYGNHISKMKFPGSIESPEGSFVSDIRFYREDAVSKFNEKDIFGFSRAYRGYLMSCVSLVDCFLYRYTFHVKNMIPSTADYDNTKDLDSRLPIEERIDAWVTIFAYDKINEYKNNKQWSEFICLKKKRNEIIHPATPTIPYEAIKIAKHLNSAKEGVGGLLTNLRKFAGQTGNIGFIRETLTLPEIKILKKGHV